MHKNLVKRALEAIRAVHHDISVDIETIFDSLCELREEIELLITAVDEDIARRDDG